MAQPRPLEVTVEKVVAAAPQVVYGLVSDVCRMPQFSPETVQVSWIGGATGPTVGARFKGKNEIGRISWSTKPTVIEALPGRRFAFRVPGRSGATWTYDFAPVEGGTMVTESMRQAAPSQWPIRVPQRRAGVTDRASHLRDGMTSTLRNLAAVAEQPRAEVR
ncbi:MAG: SRPBCC family protein [Acidimicrobiia bacterium]